MSDLFRRIWNWLKRKFGFGNPALGFDKKAPSTRTYPTGIQPTQPRPRPERQPPSVGSGVQRPVRSTPVANNTTSKFATKRSERSYYEPAPTQSDDNFMTGVFVGQVLESLNNPRTPTPAPAAEAPRPSYTTREAEPTHTFRTGGSDAGSSFRTGGTVENSGFRTGGTESTRDWTPVEKPTPAVETKSYSSYDGGSKSDSSSSYERTSSSSSYDSGSSSSSSYDSSSSSSSSGE